MTAPRKKLRVWFSAGLICLIVGMAVCASVGYAQNRYKGEWILPEHYPDGFHGWGRIDRLDAAEIVIDDTLYPLSPSVQYNIPLSSNVRASRLQIGDTVGYLMDDDGLIVSLWRISLTGY